MPLEREVEYVYKFIVDDEWFFDLRVPTKEDQDGNINNVCQIGKSEVLPELEEDSVCSDEQDVEEVLMPVKFKYAFDVNNHPRADIRRIYNSFLAEMDIKKSLHEENKVLLAKHKDTECHLILKRYTNIEMARRVILAHRAVESENVFQLHDYVVFKDFAMLTYEFLEDGNLLNVIHKCGPLEESLAADLFRQIAAGVGDLHAKNWVHLDIKCENICLSNTKPKLIDLDFARFCKDRNKIDSTSGTPEYCAPERLEWKPYDGFAADVWSLGLVLYQMLFSISPFKADPNIEDVPAAVRILIHEGREFDGGECSTALLNLLKVMLHRDPLKRIKLADVLQHEWLNGSSMPKMNMC